MFFEISELAEYVWISAFEGGPDDIEQALRVMQEKFRDVSVQLVDLDRVAGSRYLLLATLNASKSFRSRQPITRSLGMEILLYIAASRQIGEALKHVGITAESRRTATVVVGSSRIRVSEAAAALRVFFAKEDVEGLLDKWDDKRIKSVRSNFGICDKELSAILRKHEGSVRAIERLVIERSAMLSVKK